MTIFQRQFPPSHPVLKIIFISAILSIFHHSNENTLGSLRRPSPRLYLIQEVSLHYRLPTTDSRVLRSLWNFQPTQKLWSVTPARTRFLPRLIYAIILFIGAEIKTPHHNSELRNVGSRSWPILQEAGG